MTIDQMWPHLIILGVAVLGALDPVFMPQDPSRPVRAIGEFSNMRYTDEHAYGYTVELWRDGDSVIGLLLASEGLQGDTPTGLLENIKFDSRTGALSFNARLTMGVIHPGGRPSRDLFEFSGNLKPTTLTGTIKRSNGAQLSVPSARERVQLKLQRQTTLAFAGSYADWQRHVDEILKRRGPKW